MRKLESISQNLKAMGVSYIFEISSVPISPEDRMTEDFLNESLLHELQWWEMKGDVREALIDDAERKEALESLKNILPKGYTIDVDNGIITCPGNKKYLNDMVARLKGLLSDPSKIMAEEEPMLWWRGEVDRFQDALFVGWFHAWDILTVNEFLLLSMGKSYENANAFYIGGIFEIRNVC